MHGQTDKKVKMKLQVISNSRGANIDKEFY